MSDEPATLQAILDRLVQTQGEVAQTRTGIMARMDRLQAELTMHAEARVVDFATAERAERIAKDTQSQSAALLSSLSEQVNGMWRVIRRMETELRDLRGSAS